MKSMDYHLNIAKGENTKSKKGRVVILVGDTSSEFLYVIHPLHS